MRHHERRPVQEEDQIPRRPVIFVLVSTLAISLALGAISWLLFAQAERERRPSLHFPEADLGPRRGARDVPESVFDGVGAGQALRMEQRRILEHWAWVDRREGVVSIPIDAAIDLTVQEAQEP